METHQSVCCECRKKFTWIFHGFNHTPSYENIYNTGVKGKSMCISCAKRKKFINAGVVQK